MVILVTRVEDSRYRQGMRYCLAWPDDLGAYVFDFGTGKVTHVGRATLAKAYNLTDDLKAARKFINSEMDRVLKP